MRGGFAATYAAVRAEEAEQVLARIPAAFAAMTGCDPANLDVSIVPWNIIPGRAARAVAAAELVASGPQSVLFIGSCSGGEWATWHLNIPAPPAPR
jgi:hypothetical protein